MLRITLPDLEGFGTKEWHLDEIAALEHYAPETDEADSFTPRECDARFLEGLATLVDMKGIQTVLFLFCVISKLKHGLTVKLGSDLPMGAGLGSSASFCVCLSTALLAMYDVHACSKCEQCAAASGAPCAKQSELINSWSLQGEKIMHGTPSGIDNAVATYGRALTFTRRDGFKTLASIPPLRLLIVDTRVSRSTKVLVENVIQRHKTYPTLIEPVAVLIDTITQECLLAFERYSANQDQDQLQNSIELMIDMNQALLSGCFGVGHDTLDTVVSVSKSFGFHSKLTGAGGGGCAFTLLKPSTDKETVDRLKDALKSKGFDSWEATIGDQGVTIHSTEQ
eukprot:gene8388-9867_t